jgi:Na+-translocating ferredoxin:NAD+ oxidoreductase RnfC subunit
LLLKKQQQEERRRLKREALKKKIPQKQNGDAVIDPVAAALARVKAKKREQATAALKNTTDLTPAQQKQIEEADARRRAAREQRS